MNMIFIFAKGLFPAWCDSLWYLLLYCMEINHTFITETKSLVMFAGHLEAGRNPDLQVSWVAITQAILRLNGDF